MFLSTSHQSLFGLGAALSYKKSSSLDELGKPFGFQSGLYTPFQTTCATISVIPPYVGCCLELRVHLCLVQAPPG